MNNDIAKIWAGLKTADKQEIFTETGNKIGLPPAAIEKDWWVTRTLELVFQTEIGLYTVFKGGTSLSKAWNLIDRFSEDIDLALDRKFLGFEKADTEMSGSQVSKLRRNSLKYITKKYFPLLQNTFQKAGFTDVELKLSEIKSDDEDPVIIEVNYPVVTKKLSYLPPRVLIEIGSRSLKEPFSEKQFSSFVGEHYKGRDFADNNISIATVNPERTFLEKIFLLHEELQQDVEKIKVYRKSRHLYDLEKLMDSEFGVKALEDKGLYQHIVEHRRTITPLRGIDYDNHSPDRINPIPPDEMMEEWKKDYEEMQEYMIYGKSLSFDILIERLTELKTRINNL
ncbi:MAG: nucleotidyl transferase AbiEii/AbiGii toxin family protein [Ignavibacteriae bacterium]|nr:nucleotidyl transferase AbiEii/AbiGii toxin family protein [Ignavibacteriota bacterium]